MHDAVTIGIPTFVILAGILFSRSEIKELCSEMKDFRSDLKDLRNGLRTEIKELHSEMNRRFDKVDQRFDLVDVELRHFHGHVGKTESRLDALEKAR